MVALDIIKAILVPVWSIFTDNNVPGLGVPFSTFLIAGIIVSFSIAIVKYGFGFGGGTSYRSGSTRNPKISDNRKGDEF